MAKETKKVKIQWYRSAIAAPEKHKVIVRSLGLTKLNQVVERPDTAAIAAWWRRSSLGEDREQRFNDMLSA